MSGVSGCINGFHCYHYPEGPVWICGRIWGRCCHCGASERNEHGPFRPDYSHGPFTGTPSWSQPGHTAIPVTVPQFTITCHSFLS